jgi:predicted transcriptional regulator
VRTTLTLDDDVEAKLRAEARRTGQPLKSVINEALRSSLQRSTRKTSKPFRVKARDLGELRPGLSIDNVGELLELLEGSSHR